MQVRLVGIPNRVRTAAGLAALMIAAIYAAPVQGQTLQQQVTSYSGPTYADLTYTPTITASDFALVGTSHFGLNPTDIVDPSAANNAGSFSLNIALTSGSPTVAAETNGTDFLTETISTPPARTVFTSTQLAGYGTIPLLSSGVQTGTEYWFAFKSSGTTTAPLGFDIGGYLTNNSGVFSDVKTFGFSPVPTPSSLLGGLALMSGLGMWNLSRRRRASRGRDLV